jgi:hypothetical protein
MKPLQYQSQVRSRAAAGAMLAMLALFAKTAQAREDKYVFHHPKYQQECGSCHIAFPPQLLSAVSWRAVMSGLDKHFGADTSLEPADRADILRFLEANSGKYSNSMKGTPLLRISETRWFVHEHSESMPRDVWKQPAVKSVTNCTACHTVAEKGDYSERTLRLPKGVQK